MHPLMGENENTSHDMPTHQRRPFAVTSSSIHSTVHVEILKINGSFSTRIPMMLQSFLSSLV
jgi:hypothetical protein